MSIILNIGLNHRTAPIEIREKFYLNELQRDLILSELRSDPRVVEAVVLSTCNRTELTCVLLEEPESIGWLIQYIADIKKNPRLLNYESLFYVHTNKSALNHILRVACSLDSSVLGEKQILGQMKGAFERSHQKRMLQKSFNILANIVTRAGKKAQTETEIGYGGSSVSWAAIVKAEKVLKTLEGKRILIIGAGKMSAITLSLIKKKGFQDLFLINRTHEVACELARKYGGTAVPFLDIKSILPQVDLCICASAAPHYIIDKKIVEECLIQAGRLAVFIDISMPRNIDPKVSELDNIVYFDIDHLDSFIEENLKKRQNAVPAVERIIDAKLLEYENKLQKIRELNPSHYQEFFV